jgi:tripartite-type tricarboxylate transporter receptor subunit TctC
VPVKNLQEFLAYAKANPNKLTYGSTGQGTATHLFAEMFSMMTGIKMTHVPYKGVAPAIADLVGGHVPMVFGSVSEVLRFYKGGKLRVLGVSSDRRLAQMPEVPTVAEQGFAGYRVITWNGLVAPAAVPRDVLSMLVNAIRPACKDASFTAKFEAMDADAWCSTPAEFADMLRTDWTKWGEAVKFSGATTE